MAAQFKRFIPGPKTSIKARVFTPEFQEIKPRQIPHWYRNYQPRTEPLVTITQFAGREEYRHPNDLRTWVPRYGSR